MQYAGKEVQHASKWGNNELSATVSVTGTTSMYKHQGDLLKLRVVLQHGRMVTTTSMDQALVRQSGAHRLWSSPMCGQSSGSTGGAGLP